MIKEKKGKIFRGIQKKIKREVEEVKKLKKKLKQGRKNQKVGFLKKNNTKKNITK
ncbi:hypothetical protein [Campylobacter jejuni]|uniref:hypothetical protein n=1 Tax=Campylobacter jejuni TaxID=197 RepID=UPI0013EED9F1|nr:hypothetical protein [Campylobacter jejuni]